MISVRTRSTGTVTTVHTSAKARLTSVAILVTPFGESVREQHENIIISTLEYVFISIKLVDFRYLPA